MKMDALLAGLLLASACATSRPPTTRSECEAQADAEYRRCQNPQFPQPGTPAEVTDSHGSQACRDAYQQAVMRCEAMELKTTSTSTSAMP